MDDLRIHSAYKKAGLRQFTYYGFKVRPVHFMRMRVSSSSSLISFLRDWKSANKWGTSKGFTTTFPPGQRIVTVLFYLETSIPTMYMFIKMSLLI